MEIPCNDFPPPVWVHTTDQDTYDLPIRRGVTGWLATLRPVFKALWEGSRFGTQALLCYSRGQERHEKCEHCESNQGPFPECVVLYNTYKNRCANCILSQQNDCFHATRYLHERDDDYHPPRRSDPRSHSDRRISQRIKRARGCGQNHPTQRPASQTHPGRRQGLQNSVQRVSGGSENDPIDLTEDAD